jgi:hypothetical protein
MNQVQKPMKKPIDWKWLLVSFCFLVLFHLVPSSLASGLKLFFSSRSWDTFALFGVGGIAAISGYIGYRSSGKAILEPGIAALLYIVLLRLIVVRTGSSAEYVGRIPTWLVILPIAYLIGCAGAMVGAWFYRRRQKNNAADLPA